jgi:hypothetical protein
MSSLLKSRELPIIVLSIFSLITILDYYVKVPALQSLAEGTNQFAYIISIVTLGVGAISLFELHLKKINAREADWPFSVWTLLMIVVTFVMGIALGLESSTYSYWFNTFYGPARAAVAGMIVFFAYAVAFRGFRARNLESTLLIIVLILALLRDAPIGAVIWPGFPTIGYWLKDVITSSALRAVVIGTGIGGVAAGIRAMLGRERGVGA